MRRAQMGHGEPSTHTLRFLPNPTTATTIMDQTEARPTHQLVEPCPISTDVPEAGNVCSVAPVVPRPTPERSIMGKISARQ